MNTAALNAELLSESLVPMPARLSALLSAPLRSLGSVFASATPDEAKASAAAVLPDDWRDVQATLGGDGAAYARLVRRYQDDVAAYMWRFTRDSQAWEELVHDVFVEAYCSLASFKGRAPLVHWLRKIATRVGCRWWKRSVRQRAEGPVELQSCDAVLAADGAAAAREAAELVHGLLARMSVRDRLVLTLIYLEECSVAETARLTGWTQTMVKVQAHRARKRLKELCRRLEVEP